jgi:hypothetical protein
MNFNLA